MRLNNTDFCFRAPKLIKLQQLNYAKACAGKKLIKKASIVNVIHDIDRRK